MLAEVERWTLADTAKQADLVARQKVELARITARLDRLLEVFIDGTIGKDDFTGHKEKLTHEKAALAQSITDFEVKGVSRFKPLVDFITASKQAKYDAQTEELEELRNWQKNRFKPDFCGGDSGEENGRAGGSRGASRVAFGKRVLRFVRRDRRASRRLCRTFGLPDFGKSSAFRLLFDRRGKRVAVHPDPFGGRDRRRVIGGSFPVARLEYRSRVARPLSASVVGRCRKSLNIKMAEGEGFEPPVPVRALRFSRPAH